MTFVDNFTQVVGFSAGQYPSSSTTTAQSFLSNTVPQINPVSSYLLRCNLIDNPFSQPPDILTSFTSQGTKIGQLIDVKPNEFSWIDIADGSRPNVSLVIVDQLERFVKFKDTQIVIQLRIRTKAKKK